MKKEKVKEILKKIYFHIKWVFKKRYKYHVSVDYAGGLKTFVIGKYDLKHKKITIIDSGVCKNET